VLPFNSCGETTEGLVSIYRKAFWIWLGVMVPAVIALIAIGLTCDHCHRSDLGSLYRTLPAIQ